MAKYRVNLRANADMVVRVEAEDEEAAIEAAYEDIPSGVCAHCSGWGRKWSLDIGEWEPADQEITLGAYPAAELEEK